MNFKCLFGHKYNVINVIHIRDTSYMSKREIEKNGGAPSTKAIYKCFRCGKVTDKYYFRMGFLSKEDCEIK